MTHETVGQVFLGFVHLIFLKETKQFKSAISDDLESRCRLEHLSCIEEFFFFSLPVSVYSQCPLSCLYDNSRSRLSRAELAVLFSSPVFHTGCGSFLHGFETLYSVSPASSHIWPRFSDSSCLLVVDGL